LWHRCKKRWETSMQRILNLLLKRKQSTQRVDDMPSGAARAALDQRLNRLLASHANQPVQVARQFAPLVDQRQLNGLPTS
jgi:hypothetical protein